ncbi:hypothetical protein QQ045_004895 [Rhodiola kirilowii]
MDPFNFDESFNMYEEQMRAMDETCNSFVMDAVAFVKTGDEDDVQPRRRRLNQQRQRGPRGQNLLDDYFVEHPIFSERNFRRRYSSFVKSIPNPQTEAVKLYTTKHESYRNDVERCFGILQSRWAILLHSSMQKSVSKTIVLAYIILHNMIVEEEFVEVVEQDSHNPTNAFTVYDGPTDHNGNRIPHDPVGRAQRSEAFDERLTSLQSAYLYTQLQSDLMKHNWFIQTSERL